jgi:hypothetical protein
VIPSRLAAPILALALAACAASPPAVAPRLGVEGHVLRLHPGDDVKASLEAFARERHLRAATVTSAVGSLTDVGLRFANQHDTTHLAGHFEVVSLSGYLAEGELHLHMAVSDGEGKTVGGHFAEGNRVYTTLVLAIDEHFGFAYRRERDPVTGRDELVVAPR